MAWRAAHHAIPAIALDGREIELDIIVFATGFDAILLDVDNGPEPMTHSDNAWLYSLPGLQRIYERLRPAGIEPEIDLPAGQLVQNVQSLLKSLAFAFCDQVEVWRQRG